MKSILSLIFLTVSLNLFAATSNWRAFIHDQLPEPLQFIELNKTEMKDVEKKLGKANLVEKNKHYYEADGYKYSLEISYKNKKVQEMYFTFTKNRPSIENLKIDFDSLSHYPSSGGAAGRFLKYQDKDGEIVIDPIQKKIYAVRIK